MDEERLVVSALGDSITAGTPFWDPDVRVRASIGRDVDERHQWPYWVERDNPRVCVRNLGVNLERTDQIRARLDDALAEAQVVILQGGINDVVQRRELAATVDDLAAMIRRAKEVVGVVAITNVLPWNNGYPGHSPMIVRLNEEIEMIARSEGIQLLDFYTALEDPERAGRMPDPQTSDGNHPSLAGHRSLAAVVARFLRERTASAT